MASRESQPRNKDRPTPRPLPYDFGHQRLGDQGASGEGKRQTEAHPRSGNKRDTGFQQQQEANDKEQSGWNSEPKYPP